MPEPIYLIAAGALVVLVVVFAIIKRRGGRGGPQSVDPRLRRDLETGNYEQAAQRALESGNLEQAFELFLRAQKIMKAALIAEQLGRFKEAAELLERAGDIGHAAALYKRLGNRQKADELMAEVNAKATVLATPATPFSVAPIQSAPTVSFTSVESVKERARALEVKVDALIAKAAVNDAEARLLLPSAAREASDAWLAAGDLAQAAGLCRRAGLIEQAVNLYTNLLGEPATAAAILAERGEHQRAAELFEVAGQRERALAAWLDWSHKATDPLEHVAAVSRLGQGAVEKLLTEVLHDRPLAPNTAVLHYRVAMALGAHGASQRAASVLERALTVAPELPGAREQLVKLRGPGAEMAATVAGPSAAPWEHAESRAPVRAAIPRDVQLEQADVAKLAAEVAAQAVKQATLALGARGPKKDVISRGVEHNDLALAYANDPAVLEARSGPSMAELQAMIVGNGCDLINIEVFYRLALAQVANGRWEEARRNFALVEDTSRGYRDAKRRAEEIAQWQRAIAEVGAIRAQTEYGGVVSERRYTLLGELGRGGMAVVYRARDDMLAREVALKFISEQMSGDERVRQLFEREARAVASLNHPNIVTVYDTGVLDGRPYLCMELVEGTTIEQELGLYGRLKVLDALRVCEQALAALEYAHDRRIMHRDVKPANMMRTKRGLVKLMDFGLAKSTDARQSTVISGTPAYMSPEQLIGRNVDGRSDVFAAGASLYQMLTGRLAFENMRRDQAPPPIGTSLPGAPKLLEWAVSRALELEVEARFSTAGEMRQVLTDILEAATRHAREAGGVSLSAIVS